MLLRIMMRYDSSKEESDVLHVLHHDQPPGGKLRSCQHEHMLESRQLSFPLFRKRGSLFDFSLQTCTRDGVRLLVSFRCSGATIR
jgi:hypothetical protein